MTGQFVSSSQLVASSLTRSVSASSSVRRHVCSDELNEVLTSTNGDVFQLVSSSAGE